MKSITRYMTLQITTVAVFATIVLCMAIVLVQSIRFIDLIVNRGLPLSDFGYLALLITPRFLAVVLPISLFGAILFTYNRMIIGSELIVLRSSGMSTLSLSVPGILVGLVCMIICYGLTLFFVPLSAQNMRLYLNDARSELSAVLIKEGQFTVISDQVTVYAKARDSNGDLLGVIIHNKQEDGSSQTVMADRGAIAEEDGGVRLFLSNGTQQSMTNGDVHVLNFDEYTFELVEERQDTYYWQQPKERYLPDLLWPSGSSADEAYYGKLIAEGHNRLAQPLLAISYAFVALAFVLRSGFDRRGQLKPIMMAVVVMTAMLAANLGIVSAGSKTPALLIGLYLVPVAAIVLSYLALRRRYQRPTLARRDMTGLPDTPNATA
ncbi:MAG: LptF/LptG family permease [Alphaproteobacteria bacterium]